MTTISIGNSVTTIVENTFRGCTGLTSVTIPDSVTTIGSWSFSGCIGLTSVIIGNSVTSIGEGAFEYCAGLTSVTVPNSVTTIGSYSFFRCTNLTSLSIGNSVTSIGDYAFYNCSALISISFGNSVTNIGSGSFDSCSALTSITIPNSVTSIGSRAFAYCTGLTSVICTIDTPLSINSNVFDGVNQSACSLIVPAGSITSYQAAAVWKDFSPITCPNSTENITSITACDSYTWANNSQTYTLSGTYTGTTSNCVTEVLNLTINTSGQQTTFISGGLNYVITSPTTVAIESNVSESGSIIIPASVTTSCGTYAVTSISNRAFVGNSGLTSITIPDTVTSIGNDAFLYCSNLASITIPNSVYTIGTVAFAYCTSLTSVTIPNSISRLNNGLFRGCNNLTTVNIPSSVSEIGYEVFRDCSSLTSLISNITYPVSVNETTFGGVNQGACSLTVPAGSVEAYQAAPFWQYFAPINCSGSITNTTTISACDTYTWANNNQTYTESGTYTGTTTNCVTEILTLTITQSTTNTTSITACGSYTWSVNGQTYTSSDTYTSLSGCHIEELILTINPLPSNPSLSLLDQYCNTVSGYLGLKTQNQTFTAGTSGNLDKISVYLGNPNGDASATTLTVRVYEGSGTNGTLLGSQTYTYPAQEGFQFTDFNFSNIEVVQGQVYTFEVNTPTMTYGFLAISATNEYNGGVLNSNPEWDVIFKTYVLHSNQSFCQGATISNLLADGNNVSWYNAATGGNQLNSTTLLETGTYFVTQTGNSCESERTSVNVLVNPTTAITSQPAPNFICSTVGSTSTFTVVSNAVSPSYTWQYRVVTTANSNPDWITITSANAAVYSNFNTATLTVTKTTLFPATGTQYRVLVTGTCGNAKSDVAPLTILSTVKAGTISSTASVCVGSNITLTLGAYAGSSFQWQSAATATGVFANIPGATGTTYTILGATATINKSYRVIVTNSCASTSATTAIKTLTVNPTSVAGTVIGGGNVCSGSNGTLKVAGYVGTIQWQSSANGIDFLNVTGTAATFTASNIIADTYFRAKITSGLCSETYSNVVKYTIASAAISGTLTASASTVCSGTGTTITLTGSVGSIKWWKSTNWTVAIPTWTAVTTSTSETLATGNLSVATAYKAEVTIGSCSTETSEVVPVLVYAAPLAKTITANTTTPTGATATLAICNTSSSKVLTIGTGSNGAIQWQKSTTSATTGFADIANQTGISYVIMNPAIGVNYFRAKFTNSCGASVYGTAFTVYYKECAPTKTVKSNVTGKSSFGVVSYPNPFTNNFNLNVTSPSSENVKVSVYDMIGKLIYKNEVHLNAVSELQIGDNYPNGIYNVVVTQGKKSKTLRVIKR